MVKMAKNKVKKGSKNNGAKKHSIPPKALPVTLLSGFLVSYKRFSVRSKPNHARALVKPLFFNIFSAANTVFA